ncbi:unnamed protein product [Vitrella brassicaformis CCMP3155]|uniref:Chitin-binding type-4 domain-containing protein n=2 Tax=Vitrella brassicaformis TaxID=1169539 RepID=A0A0G4F0N0_VITBC|nr:unnamed protein product [Vitrella brassicaformis CCMP3155]|mmetsp:Transcript_53865/g.135363  ORF Transcript_53865/g.135363 Transcript_53865/m.135363 type:complete len:367 (+) Transcript_53865:42-1142(+)|eukprot:CEM05283.1 unnamed protein product [Vitrella brassicaformis CCMP3155]
MANNRIQYGRLDEPLPRSFAAVSERSHQPPCGGYDAGPSHGSYAAGNHLLVRYHIAKPLRGRCRIALTPGLSTAPVFDMKEHWLVPLDAATRAPLDIDEQYTFRCANTTGSHTVAVALPSVDCPSCTFQLKWQPPPLSATQRPLVSRNQTYMASARYRYPPPPLPPLIPGSSSVTKQPGAAGDGESGNGDVGGSRRSDRSAFYVCADVALVGEECPEACGRFEYCYDGVCRCDSECQRLQRLTGGPLPFGSELYVVATVIAVVLLFLLVALCYWGTEQRGFQRLLAKIRYQSYRRGVSVLPSIISPPQPHGDPASPLDPPSRRSSPIGPSLPGGLSLQQAFTFLSRGQRRDEAAGDAEGQHEGVSR